MNEINYICPCLFGLESLVADELRTLGMDKVASENGRVLFSGGPEALARANIGLRCAERVLINVGEFEAKRFDDLFEGVKALEWERWIGREDSFPVAGWSLNSALHSVPDCQSIIKKAIVERLRAKYGVAWFRETGPKHQIRFSLLKDRVTLALDTSGEGLHKRGYRQNANAAPLKETLAAAMAKLSRCDPWLPFCDPFCGSGTILIEAALLLSNTAPGLRRRFTAESWDSARGSFWQEERARALAAVRNEPFTLRGADIDPAAVELTLQNAKLAGAAAHIAAEVRDIRDFAPEEERGVVVCNPPYGERMLEVRQAEALYREMGRVFAQHPGWNVYVLSASESFETLFGKKADKRRKLYNGMIKCNYYQYFRHAGGRAADGKPGKSGGGAEGKE